MLLSALKKGISFSIFVKMTVLVTFVYTDEANTIHLKCNIATSSSPCSVLDHQVPVFICNKDALSSSAWDITTQQVSNFDILSRMQESIFAVVQSFVMTKKS